MLTLLSNAVGFILDMLIGDPRRIPHPVIFIGRLISALEKRLRKIFPKTDKGEFAAGVILGISVPLTAFLISGGILFLCYKINVILWFLLHTFWAFQIPASKGLNDESRKVYSALKNGDIPDARLKLSYLVGRETSQLNEEEIAKTCVETVAENTSDGITAPMFYMMIGGVPLGFFYKAVNTLDSMVGYRNEEYEHLGKFSASLDDVMNFIPSRICGLLMIASSFILRLNTKNSAKIFVRDRKKHLSPNSAQTESAVSGALGIQLGGTHTYFGKTVEKPTIGDELRKAECYDIVRADRIMLCASLLSVILFGMLRFLILKG